MKPEIAPSSAVKKLRDLLLVSVSTITLVYLLNYHVTLITFPWPIQYREGAILLSTNILLHGSNPYSMELQPYYANAYGLFYNLLVLPFAWIFGPTLMLHKLIAGVSTLLTLALIFYTMKRHSIPLRYSIPATAMLYSSLLYSKTSLAEPDSTGTLLLLAAMLIPIFKNFSSRSLAVSILLSGLGFFTKPYFVFGIVGVGFCLLLSRQWKKLMYYTIASGLFIAAELAVLSKIFDAYIINVLLANYVYGKDTSKWDWIITQLTFVITHDKFFFCVALAATIFYWTSAHKSQFHQEQKHIVVAFGAMLLIFIVVLGKNTGAHATYIYQLPLPLLCLITASLLSKIEACRIVNLLHLALILAMISICLHYPSISNNSADNQAQWEKAKQLVQTHKNILNSPAIAPLLIQEGKKSYDSGQSEMFFYGLKRPETLTKDAVTRAQQAKQQFGDTIYNGVVNKKFDLIMLDREFSKWLMPPVAIMNTYSYKGFLTLEMPHNNFRWQVDIWEPKK